MDIHRCRFIPYPASAINALAFSHPSKPGKKIPSSLRLALGRANGDIEIWDPRGGKWAQETVCKGGKNRSIEGLAWTQDLETNPSGKRVRGHLRLFSIGASSVVTEWNLAIGMPLRHSSSNYGDVWCMAAQPLSNSTEGADQVPEQLLALGCSDGTIVLQSTADGDLAFVRTLQRPSNRKARVLSLIFNGKCTLIAGYSDGSIHIHDIRGRGTIKHTMSLGSGPKNSPILVWSLKCLTENILVSGDSTGELKFWDLKTATLTQRLLAHGGDVVTVASSADGQSLLCGGMDRKVSLFRCNKSNGRWSEVTHQRMHNSHVKAMTVFECKDMSVVVSGGHDSAPVVTPMTSFGSENFFTLSHLPGLPPLVSASCERLIFAWWDREVAYSRFDAKSIKAVSNGEDPLQRILIQGEENITSAAVSDSGNLLAIATNSSCRLFALAKRSSRDTTKIRKLETPSLSTTGARLIQFSPDGNWLLLVKPDSQLCVYRIVQDENAKPKFRVMGPTDLERTERHGAAQQDPLASYRFTVCRVAWSSDSHMIACGDLSGYIDTWTLSNAESTTEVANGSNETSSDGLVNGHSNGSHVDSKEHDAEDLSPLILGQRWNASRKRLPRLPSMLAVLSFRPAKHSQQKRNEIQDSIHTIAQPSDTDDRLIAVTSHNEVYEYHILEGRLTEWSKRNPPASFPGEFRIIKDRTTGCIWDVTGSKQRLWLHGSTWLWMFDLSRDLPQEADKAKLQNSTPSPEPGDHLRDAVIAGRKRKRGDDEDSIVPDVAETSDDDDDYAATSTVLTHFRRSEADPSDALADDTTPPHHWHTFKYRSILGIVPLVKTLDKDDDDDGPDIEVALVERPLWEMDVELPFLSTGGR